MSKLPFKLPKSFLTQLNEFTTGYALVTVNEEGQFESFIASDTPAIRLGLTKFVGMLADTLDEAVSAPQQVPMPPPDGEEPTDSQPA